MGLNPKHLPKGVRKRMGITIMGGRARTALKPPRAGVVMFRLKGPPPTATHHAKSLSPIGDWKRGKGRMTLKDDPALVAAREYYARQIPHSDTPIAGPVIAFVTWYFPLPAKPKPGEVPGADMQRKPDRDNAAKALFDILALHGWLEADEQVTDGPLTKRWAEPGFEGVSIELHTKCGHYDELEYWSEIVDANLLGVLRPLSDLPPPKPMSYGSYVRQCREWIEWERRQAKLSKPPAIRQATPRPRAAAKRSARSPGIGASRSPTRQNRSHAVGRAA